MMVKEPVPQYVVNTNGERTAVILDIETFEEMLDIIDDYYCTIAYDESKPAVDAEIERGAYSTLDEFLVSLRKKHPAKKKNHRK